MEYKEFKNRLLMLVQEKLEGEEEAFFLTREKNNQMEKEGICIQKTDGTQQTVIYLKELYDSYKDVTDLGRIAEKLITIFQGSKDIPEADVLQDWESVKDAVQIRLVKKEWNRENLKSWVYREYLDFAVVLAVELYAEGGWSGSTPVKKESLELWGISEDEAYRKAMENLNRENYQIVSMDELLPEGYSSGEWEMYVLMRENKGFGAGLMLREDILHRFAKEQGCSLYILPSSRHELILLKQEKNMDSGRLKEVVRLVNAEPGVLMQEDLLSDNVYYYDRETREITIVP